MNNFYPDEQVVVLTNIPMYYLENTTRRIHKGVIYAHFPDRRRYLVKIESKIPNFIIEVMDYDIFKLEHLESLLALYE